MTSVAKDGNGKGRCPAGGGIVLTGLLVLMALASMPRGVAAMPEEARPGGDAVAGASASGPGQPPGDTGGIRPQGSERVARTDPVDDYLDAIARAEATKSAYSMELADLYLGLGQHYLEREEYQAARKAYLRGMQVLRVNLGPNSPEQTEWMFSLADIESRMGDVQSADKIMDGIYRINAGINGSQHPDMLPVLKQMYSWYQSHYPVVAPAFRYENLSNTERVASEMAKILEQQNGPDHPETANAYRVIGQLNYFMAKQLSQDDVSEQSKFTFTTGRFTQPPNISTSVSTHFRQGRDAFARYAEAVNGDATRPPVDRADAIAQLGDWYLLFDKPQSAEKSYRQAYDVLHLQAATPQLADEFFGRPKPLQILRNTADGSIPASPAADAPRVEVLLSVTKTGRVRNIEVVKLPAGLDQDDEIRIRKHLKTTRFRPRLIAGVPERTEQFRWNYVVKTGVPSP